jgi:threonine dehydrogenase-like Zn-dependent dehydrogenase
VAENVLADGGEVGFEHPGGYGQYLLTESRNLHLLPDDLPFHDAALVEPLAVSVRALRRLAPEGHPSTLIFGDGPIGLLILMLLHWAGATDIVLVGGRTGRLTAARRIGASQTLNYHALGADLAGTVRQECQRRFACVIEASGADAAMRASLSMVAPSGRVLIVGDYGSARADFGWNQMLHQEISLIGSCASAGAWQEAVRLASSRELPLGALVTHRVPVGQFKEGLKLARGHLEGVIKVVLEWEDGLVND